MGSHRFARCRSYAQGAVVRWSLVCCDSLSFFLESVISLAWCKLSGMCKVCAAAVAYGFASAVVWLTFMFVVARLSYAATRTVSCRSCME
jgi:hypothetical protein